MIDVNELPSIQSSIKDEVKFRGGASSHNYNDLQEDIFFDLANLFNTVNAFDETLVEISQNTTIDNTYTQIRLNKLEALLKQKQAELDGYKNTDSTSFSKVIFPSDFKNNNSSEYKAFINTMYDQLSVRQHTTISKLYLYDTISDVVTIPNTLKINLTPTADNIKIFDNDFNKVFSKNDSEYFVRKVVNNDVDYVDVEIEITLPDNIISNRDVNVIQFSPFPYASVDVMSIQYKLNGNWADIPGIKSHKNADTIISKDVYGSNVESYYIKNAENVKLCFNKTAMSTVKISLRQRTFIEENGNRTFYVGLKSLDINCEVVNDEYCDFYASIEFDNVSPKTITGIIPVFNNDVALSDSSLEKKSLISYELYYINEQGDREYIKNSFPMLADKKKYEIVAKMYYDSIGDINPSLYSLKVLYNNN